MANLRSRYPGLRPFDPGEQNYFFGRDQEIESVCRLLDLDNLTVLHSPSGMGKSSLINAGILPALKEIRKWDVPYHVVPIRFNNYDPELARIRRENQGLPDVDTKLVKDPIERFITACLGEHTTWEDVIPMPKPSLWLTAKKMLVDQAVHQLRIIFILDQFEELFTYPEARVEEFARQLGELYHQVMPASVRKGLERKNIMDAELSAQNKLMTKPKEAQLMARIEAPLDVKILVSMRSDKLFYLERLNAYIPEIKLNSCELKSFDSEQAKKAITKPAALPGEGFISPVFTISDEVLNHIIHFLQDKVSRRIDPSSLQIVCQHIERKMMERERKMKK